MAAVVFSGCQSKPEPDTRPSWVQEAEARLQRPPSWQVSGSGVDSGGESEKRSSFFGSGQATTASTGGSQEPEESSRPSPARRQPTTESEPPGVEWGETKITVSVED